MDKCYDPQFLKHKAGHSEKFPCNSHPSLSILLLRTKDQSLVCSSTHISMQMQINQCFYIFLPLIQILTRLKAGGEGDDRGWDGWMASPTQWTWIWVNFRSWWWTGRASVLRFMGSQSQTWLGDWTELNWKSLQMVTAAMKLKHTCFLEEKLWPT